MEEHLGFYQGFIDAFSNHIISSMENTITNKIMVGASKLDSFLGSLPKKIDVDNVAAMNVTFVNDPLFKSSSVEFDMDYLFHLIKLLFREIGFLEIPNLHHLLLALQKSYVFHWMKMFSTLFLSTSRRRSADRRPHAEHSATISPNHGFQISK